jgi:aminodeoxyfutalosine synthase
MQLPEKIQNSVLRQIAEKVVSHTPVSENDARIMLNTPDILELGMIAHHVRTELHGNRAYYGVNMNLNYTNICELKCPLCAFSKDRGEPGAYVMSLDEIREKVSQAAARGIDEVHIVGGVNPELKLDYFENMLRSIKEIDPDLFIVAFTAVEYDYFARINNLPVDTVFDRLIAAGVGALPGGGAEIFAPHIREHIAPLKISGKQWLDIMRIAHSKGLETNVTLLYNHGETAGDIVDHLYRIRRLQDETHGFKTFVPLVFHEENTKIKARRPEPTGFDDIRLFATARVYLHNLPHIKALWMYVGEKMAQILLRFGVDDIGSTYDNEKVVHAAGAKTADIGSEDHLKRLITGAHCSPVRTTAGYGRKTGSRI